MENTDKLVELVTAEIMRRIGQVETKKVLVLGKSPECKIAECLQKEFTVGVEPNLNNMQEFDFVVLPANYLHNLIAKAPCEMSEAQCSPSADSDGVTLDFSTKKLIHERELIEKCTSRVSHIRIVNKAIVTQLAADFIKRNKITIIRVD